MLRLVSAAALLLLALVAAGCGDAATATSPSTQTAADQDAARLKFAQCMRQNGINLPDDPGQAGGRQAFADVDQTKLQAAQKACQKYRDAAMPKLTDAQRQEFQDAFAKFSDCMGKQGVDLPTPGERGAGPPAGFDRNDPAVQAAMKVCQDLRPQRPGGAGGAGGAGGVQR